MLRGTLVIVVMLLASTGWSAGVPPCVACAVAPDDCLACGAGVGDRLGAFCRTGGPVSCPTECYVFAPCDTKVAIGPSAAVLMLTIFSLSGSPPTPFVPPPYSEMTVQYAESMVLSEGEVLPAQAEISNGIARLGLGFAFDAQRPASRRITISDEASRALLISGIFSAGTRMAVAIPGTTLAVSIEWRPMAMDEIGAERLFHGSLNFVPGSGWYMVR